jgi:hypothetical protein
MPAAVLTYSELVSQIRLYCERPNDTALLTQIPFLVMLAESKLAAAFKTLGIQTAMGSTMTQGAPTIAKPSYWRDNVSFRITDPTTGEQKPLLLRSYEFCRAFWPIVTVQDVPRYYADYNYENFLIVPTPAANYVFEILYHPRLMPLSDASQVNWFTENAPQLLIYGCMVEAQTWLKNVDKAAMWKGFYDDALAALNTEENARLADREAVVR